MKPQVRKILDFIRKHNRFLVSGHVRSDGDALGSQLAFFHALKKMKKKVDCVCDAGALPEYQFLPGSDKVGSGPDDLKPPYDAVITFDSGSWERLERVSAAIDRKTTTVINVDHHASNDRFGDINWVEPKYSSAGEMAWDLIKALKVKPDRKIATCIYVAIVTDTGNFAYSNTKTITHRNASELLEFGVKPAEITAALYYQKSPKELEFSSRVLNRIRFSEDGRIGWVSIDRDLIESIGYEPSDTQEYINTIRSVKGIQVALLFRELNGKVKFSFRTAEGVNGVTLARKWGGGGHERASGASVEGRTIGAVEEEVVQETIRFVNNSGP